MLRFQSLCVFWSRVLICFFLSLFPSGMCLIIPFQKIVVHFLAAFSSFNGIVYIVVSS